MNLKKLSRVSLLGKVSFALAAMAAGQLGAQQVLFSDNFGSYNLGDLDSNESGGPNQAPNGGPGNPWWGPNPGNMVVAYSYGSIFPYVGCNKIIYGNSPNFFAEQVNNIGYRNNGGANFTGNISLSWAFYDPAGAGANASGYRDMGYLNGFQTSYTPNQDYAAGAPDPQGSYANGDEILGVGANTAAAGANASVYQVRLLYSSTANNGSSYTGANGWFNTSVGRTVGWHTASITLGSANGANTTVTESIDGNVVLTGIMGSSSIDSVNSIILDSGWGSQVGAFDAITLTEVPEPGTCAILGLGMAGVLALRKRSKQQ